MLEITQDLPLGHPGFRFWAGHQVADIPGELFVTLSFYPGKASPSPPPRSVVLLYGDSESGQRSLSTFSRPDGKKLFFFLSSHQHIYLCVKTLLRKVFGSKVGNCSAKANHFPSGGKRLSVQLVWENSQESRTDRPVQPQEP